jgi:hypothetical protein
MNNCTQNGEQVLYVKNEVTQNSQLVIKSVAALLKVCSSGLLLLVDSNAVKSVKLPQIHAWTGPWTPGG